MAPSAWHWPQLRSLKIGPRPSCTVSVVPKAALACANKVALVPGSESPSAALLSAAVDSSIRLLQPPAARGRARIAASANSVRFIVLLRLSMRNPADGNLKTDRSNALAID